MLFRVCPYAFFAVRVAAVFGVARCAVVFVVRAVTPILYRFGMYRQCAEIVEVCDIGRRFFEVNVGPGMNCSLRRPASPTGRC